MIKYKQLIENHHLFYEVENRAINYNRYLSSKDWKFWSKPNIQVSEIKTLFTFVKSWDRFFRGNIESSLPGVNRDCGFDEFGNHTPDCCLPK